VRVLSATHKDLAQEVAEERFRQDLYYRLNVIELRIPSLRDHADDIAGLATTILARLADEYDGNLPKISSAALQSLTRYDFPGNIRELENVLERAFTLCDNEQIQPDDLQLDLPAQAATTPRPKPADGLDATDREAADVDADTASLPAGQNIEDYLESIERTLIVRALKATRWNKTAAAKELGISSPALRYKLKKLDLE
jgi:two-component system response regulator PilR (NtrC family)